MAIGSHRGRAGDDPGRLGGGRRARGRTDLTDEELDAARARCLPRHRLLHRALHREHDGGRSRLPRPRPSRSRRRSPRPIRRSRRRPRQAGPAGARRDRARRAAVVVRHAQRGSRTRSSASTGTGGSTNSVLHLLAIADEAGVELELDDFDRLSASTPVVTSLTPGGRFVAGDLHRVGGTAAVMKRLREHLHVDAPTVDGRTLGEHRGRRPPSPTARSSRSRARPFKPGGALRVLRGNLAPDGAVVKLAGHERPVHRGPARVFESEATCKAAVYDGVVQPGRRRRRARRRARPGRRECRRCCRSPRRSSAAGSATRSRSSPTGASAARPAG